MKCIHCGLENAENAKFCCGCGNPITQNENGANYRNNQGLNYSENEDPFRTRVYTPVPEEVISQENVQEPENESVEYTQMFQPQYGDNNAYSAERFNDAYHSAAAPVYVERGEKKSNRTLKILLSVLITAVVGCSVFLILFFCTDVFGKNCEICDAEFDSEGAYCNNCVEQYTCYGCKKVDKTVEDEICSKCKEDFTCTECGDVDKDIKESLCSVCVAQYTCENCGEVDFGIEDGYCLDCVEKYICNECGDFYEELDEGYCDECVLIYTCKDCDIFDENMEDNYCDDCKEQHICKECGSVEDELVNGFCRSCAASGELNFCFHCYKDINTATAYKDNDGYYYCDSCDTGNYCTSCKAPVKNGESKCEFCG